MDRTTPRTTAIQDQRDLTETIMRPQRLPPSHSPELAREERRRQWHDVSEDCAGFRVYTTMVKVGRFFTALADPYSPDSAEKLGSFVVSTILAWYPGMSRRVVRGFLEVARRSGDGIV
ncbi:MAG: hypothetical protein KJO98_16590 [Rhodothermia bacterium]|nr:hypothetical protein [Rhodothermia bacterium]